MVRTMNTMNFVELAFHAVSVMIPSIASYIRRRRAWVVVVVVIVHPVDPAEDCG